MKTTLIQIVTIFVVVLLHTTIGCQFQPAGEYLRFVRVPENLPIGGEVLQVQVYPRRTLSLRPVDKQEDIQYFAYRDVNRTTVAILLARSLEDLVDRENPQNVLKFRLVCDYNDGEDTVSSYLSVTVYVEDINDHTPKFVGTPYKTVVDEFTSVGSVIFRDILALDRDKPNTPNSDVHYSIVGGNERGKFMLDNSHRPILKIRRLLDYDNGDREFLLTIMASDRGAPPKSSNTTIKILVNDNDDLPPKFTKGVYRTRIREFYPITGSKIHQQLKLDPPIYAFDQDLAIDTPIRYDIIAGNDRRLFVLDSRNGSLFLEKEIDLDQERTLPGNTFVLQVQASQIDNPLKTGVARVEIEVMDLNDNLPEFEVDFYNISIVENLPNGFSVLQVLATDQDQGDNAEFIYVLQDKSGAFNLDSRTGWLTVRDQNVLDRERQTTIRMRVYAKEKSPSIVSSREGAAYVEIEVTLLDANDNNPTFVPTNLYEFQTIPNAQISDVVGIVRAVDPDLGRNGMVLYDIQKTTNSSKPSPFTVEAKTGKVIVAETPLQEGRHALFIEASDQPANPSERRYSLAVVTIDVTTPGSRDEIPDFVGAPYEFWVGGNAGVGTSIGQIRVSNAVNRNNAIFDLLHSYPEGVPFAVEERSGVITVVDDLSKYDRPEYDFEAVVTENTDITLVTNVTVHVVDPQNDKAILMKGTGSSPIEFRVRENLPGAMIGQLLYKNASVNSNSTNSTRTLRFIIANQQDVTDDITISQDGILYAKKALDRETRDVYRLTIIAQYNKGIISGAGIYQVTIYVDDENDNQPVFDHSMYEGTIKENCISGTEVEMNYPIKATDADANANAYFTYALFGEGSKMFRIDKHTGKVYFNSADSPLDREVKQTYNMKLVATDKGGLKSEVKLIITVKDENDNVPEFIQINILPDQDIQVLEDRFNIVFTNRNETNSNQVAKNQWKKSNKNLKVVYLALPEHLTIGIPFLKLIAEDKDEGNNALIRYEMISETFIPGTLTSSVGLHLTQYFTVQPTSGEISVARALPPESEFRLNISAIDDGGLRDNLTLKIHVNDDNDHAPVFENSFYNFDAEEGFYTKTVLGRIEATDKDFGQNANISYRIFSQNDKEPLPFSIGEFTGILSVKGELDRETRDKYNFKVIARDNGNHSQLSTSVEVEVNVLDVNDNAPQFYGYDEIISVLPSTEAQIYTNHNFDTSVMMPVYYATVAENSPIGTPITRVFANDSDFTGNGNGLILFDIPQRKKNQENLFAVDSKDGVVTTIGKLDYEAQGVHNVTIIASDLGSPSLTSNALLMVTVIDVPDDASYAEIPVFAHRYYEVEVEENVAVPTKLLTLNITEPYQSHRLRYSLVQSQDKEVLRMFKVDSRNGTVFVLESPDRERRDKYEFKVRLDRIKLGRGMPVMVYPITSERLTGLAPNEVKVIVHITDVNDNIPKFTVHGRPIVAAIPTTANYGYQIVKLEAQDGDAGINGDVRYQILGRSSDDESHRFAIDPVTGQVRSIASFSRDADRVYGFDVKATDRRGADDGKSSIANVFVYVIDERKQLVMVMGSKPIEIEMNMHNITSALYNATGYDIRIQKLEPHAERNLVDYTATDMYLYAVDPHLNIIIDMDLLQKVLHTKMPEIEQLLPREYRVLDIGSSIGERRDQLRSQHFLLSSLEVGVVVLGCIIFIGALATALCVFCIRKNRRNQQKKYAQTQALNFAIANEAHMNKQAMFPSSYVDGIHYAEPTDSYLTMMPQRNRHKHYGSNGHRHHQHDRNCVRFEGRKITRKPRLTGLETSVTSLHSSGKDSGIVDSIVDMTGRCQCGHSSTHSSEDNSSNSSYEDSLKSVSHRKIKTHPLHHIPSLRHNINYQHRRNRSFSDLQNSPIIRRNPIHQIHQLSQHPAGPDSLIGNPIGVSRRSSERVILTTGSVSLSS